MASSKSNRLLRSSLQRWLPWAVTAGVFVLLFRRIPIEKVIEATVRVDLLIYLPFMTFNILFNFFWETLVLVMLFRWFGTDVSYRGMLPIKGASFLITLLNYIAGQGGMALLMSRWRKIAIARATSIMLLSLFTDYYMLLAFCLVGAFRLPDVDLACLFDGSEQGHLVRFIVISWLVFAVTIGFFRLYLPRTRGWQRTRGNEVLAAFHEAPPARYFQLVLLKSFGSLVGSIVTAYFALSAFGLHVPFLPLIALLPIVWLIESLPISVMGMGTGQAAMIWLVARFAEGGVQVSDIEAAVFAYSLLSMALFHSGRFVIGAISVAFLPRNIWMPKGEPAT
jgi:uncharacterized membrane protein YbhN (UPF0104 family)